MLRPLSSAHSADPLGALHLIPSHIGWRDHATGSGLDFATRDYLSLRRHPAPRSVADGGHPSLDTGRFETRLAQLLHLPSAALFPSGTAAIRQTLCAILRPGDHVIVDTAAPPAMAETVLRCQAHLHRSPSGSAEGIERRITRLTRSAMGGRLFVAVPALSPQGSRITDLAELTCLARHHKATLIVDVTDDFGAMGQAGGGVMEIQGCLGRADIVVGDLAPTFASAGGFAAFRNPALRAAIPVVDPAPPVDAGALLEALAVIASPEGRRRRRNLHALALRLRNHLMSDGIKVMGQASPFVPLLLPPLTALPRTALLESAGPRVTLLQAPDVPLHAPRWRIQLSAALGPADIDDLAELIRDVFRAFDRIPAPVRVPA